MEKSLTIKGLSEEDRPREKLLVQGRKNLSKAELIAILLGSGNTKMNAIELSQHVLNSCENDLDKLAKLKVTDLTKFNGIGPAKAINIISALELGRRRPFAKTTKPVIKSSHDAFDQLKESFFDLEHEEFWLLSLNRANQVLHSTQLSIGGMSGTVVDPKIVFKKALDYGAAAIIMAHNHPSGSLKPSKNDLDITEKIISSGKTLELPLLDHLIITNHGYYSFADEGLI